MKNCLLYIILLCSLLEISAQKISNKVNIDTTSIVKKQFNKTSIDQYKNKKTFNYKTDESVSIYEQIVAWLNRVFRKIMSWFFDDVEVPVGFLMVFLKILPYIIAIIVLYLIINFFLKVNSRNIISGKTNKDIVQIKDDEELLNSKDLSKLIIEAIEEKNYRLATRYQYVLLLQRLSNKEIIVWEQQKTNEDYIKEVKSKNIHTEFEEITRFYDFVWYGNFKINYDEYLKGIKNIQKIKDII